MIKAAVPHAGALAAIHAAAFPPGANWPEAAFATLLGQPGVFGLLDPNGAFVLARQAADEAEVLTLATVPAARLQGRARALLTAAHERLRRAQSVTVFLEVAADNVAALALYEALGYRAAGIRPRYYGGTDALTMRIDL